MRRHLEGAQFQQPQAPGGTVGRVELVDAELAAVGVAGGVDEQVAQRAVNQPWRHRRAVQGELALQLVEADLDLVDLVAAGLVKARRLAGGADEHAAEQIAQRRVVVPVGDEAGQQVRPAQEGAVGGGGAAEHEVVAATSAGVAAVEHELLGRQARVVRRFVEEFGVVDEFGPVVGGVDVDLDHARVGRHGQRLQARVARRRVAFEHDLHRQLGAGGLDGGQQFEVVLQVRQRRHEDIQHAAAAAAVRRLGRTLGPGAVAALRVAHFHAQRGARQLARRLEARRRHQRVAREGGHRVVLGAQAVEAGATGQRVTRHSRHRAMAEPAARPHVGIKARAVEAAVGPFLAGAARAGLQRLLHA